MAETMPPLTVKQLDDSLNNPHFRSYIFIGEENDTGWKMAITAQKTVPALRVYCIGKVREEDVRRKYNVPEPYVGIIFGWDSDIKKMLTKEETEDFLTIIESITEG